MEEKEKRERERERESESTIHADTQHISWWFFLFL